MAKTTLSTPSYMRWLPPKTTGTIARLEFIAAGIVDGFISGKHRSPKKGSSVEFAEHRQYVPGDDLRNLDWRVLARKDRYYIKQYVEETNLRATILLDASGSMGYRGDQAAEMEGRKLSKFEYGQYIAAVLTYLLIGQQDAVGLVTFDKKMRTYIPAKAQASQVRLILEEIDRLQPGADTDCGVIFDDIAERIPHRGVVFIISDLFDDPEAIVKALHHFRFRHHEVVVLHVMAEEEITFPFDSFSQFKDLEGLSEDLELDPKNFRASYLESVREYLKVISSGCGQMNVDYVPISTKTPFQQVLTDYLARRQRGR